MLPPLVHSTEYIDHIEKSRGASAPPASPQTAGASPATPPSPILFRALCKGTPAQVPITVEALAAYINAGDGHTYRSIDVLHEVAAAVEWLDANESKRWTAKGFRAGLARWLKSSLEGRPLNRDDAALRERYKLYHGLFPEATKDWVKAACMSSVEAERIKQGRTAPPPVGQRYPANGTPAGAATGPRDDYLSIQIRADKARIEENARAEAEAKAAYYRERGLPVPAPEPANPATNGQSVGETPCREPQSGPGASSGETDDARRERMDSEEAEQRSRERAARRRGPGETVPVAETIARALAQAGVVR